MKKRKAYIIVSLIVFVSLFLFYKNSYTEFKPLSFDGNSYVAKKISNQKEFKNNLRNVLIYYNEDFKISKNGNILIKNKLQSDQELIVNYTKKALDKNWHKVE
ncbi:MULTISPECIES: hypothetical protein [Chryseobacterium]|uniref:Uncharacterized protein n=2 Tax=Chryseobacterium TaxID=59732 RepID=A0A0Q3SI09_9FLAO|nr:MULTISPECIES: hypothetical protein [Chryseobacterium]KQK24802.1 hypothetical protein AR438_14380 [Chryseobacterium aquaticum]QQV03158.1 hypothetical protein I6I61_02010 [Chryseobacterium sp. FDAARGOS 1104]VFB03540.1 Uncharacterised protein [Chryseobacterium taihuense]